MEPASSTPPVFHSAPGRITRSVEPEPTLRREVRPGDIGAIARQHGLVYSREHGVNRDFEAMVLASLTAAAARGWPGPREGAWIVERRGELAGSLGLTDEGERGAWLRWVLLDPELRGRGLGRRMISEAVAEARAHGFRRVSLETFSELKQAASLYREQGFRVVSEDRAPRWGRTEINYQRYELEL